MNDQELISAQQKPVGYWQGEFSKDGGATLYEVQQMSLFGKIYPNIPLYSHPKPAIVQQLVDAIQAAIDCGMVPNSSVSEGGAAKHSIQVRVADQLRTALKAAKEQL